MFTDLHMETEPGLGEEPSPFDPPPGNLGGWDGAGGRGGAGRGEASPHFSFSFFPPLGGGTGKYGFLEGASLG